MPIYEYYCADNNKIYQFFAKTLAQGRSVPKCPDNPAFRMTKMVSAFAVRSKNAKEETAPGVEGQPGGAGPDDSADDPRMNAAMEAMEREFSHVDENDPKAMGRMMRRMTEITGEKMDGEMEEVVRKLEEGADPESLEDQLGGGDAPNPDDPYGEDMGGPPPPAKDPKEPRQRFQVRRPPPVRDPKLYDYD